MNEPNEYGVNEVGILRFRIAEQTYGMYIEKISEILKLENLSKVPNVDVAVSGISLIRDEVVSVVDTKQILEGNATSNIEKSMVLVCEHDKSKVALSVEEVLGIFKIDVSEIISANTVSASSLVAGNINYENEIIILLDFDNIVSKITCKE